MTEQQPLGTASRPRIVVIGASAGGIEPLVQIAGGLPADLDAAVFVVVHVPARSRSVLPRVITRAGPLEATHATDGEPIRRGRIYVAPPDRHLLIKDGQIRTSRGPRENRSRPAIDPLFRSAAAAHGERVIGVVLSGSLDDGAAGLAEIRRQGGVAIVQDPAEAVYPSMPSSALRQSGADYRLPSRQIAQRIDQLVREPRMPAPRPMTSEEPSVSTTETLKLQLGEVMSDAARRGEPATFGCPDCGGTLWRLDEAGVLTFRCRVGHAYTPSTLLEAQGVNVETGLWQAVRALEEQAALASRLSARAIDGGIGDTAERFLAQAERAREHADVVRGLLEVQPAVDEIEDAGLVGGDDDGAEQPIAEEVG